MQPVSFYLTDKNIISILNRVDKTESCWNWKGIIDIKTGYGRFKLKSGYHVAHRLVYTIFICRRKRDRVRDKLRKQRRKVCQ